MDARGGPGDGDKATRTEGPVILAETRLRDMWPVLLGYGYLALALVLMELENVRGVTILLAVSAALCLLVWYGRQAHSSSVSPPAALGRGVDALRRLPSVVLWLPLPAALAWFAGMEARADPDHADYYLAFGVWLVAIIAFLGIFLVPLVAAGRRNLPALAGSIRWPVVATVGFITLVAFLVRFVGVAEEPGPFWNDEGDFASLSLEVARGFKKNFFFMDPSIVSHTYFVTMAVPFKLFGASIFWARFPHVIVGTATIPLMYLMLREMFDRRVALVGAAFVAVNHFHIHFSRIAFPNLYDTFFTALVLLFAFRAIRTGKHIDFALAGLAAGVQFYFFSGARLLPVVLVILLVYTALTTRGRFVLRNFWGLSILLTGFVIASLPAALFWDGNPGSLNARWERQNIFDTGYLDQQMELTGRSELHVLWDQFQQSLGVLVVYDDVFQHYAAGIPLLTAVGSLFFVIGGVYGLLHIYQPRFLALFALLVLTVILLGTVLGPPVATQRFLLTVPISAAFVGLGVTLVADAVGSEVPRLRRYMPFAMGAAVILIAFVNLNFYFRDYLPSDNYGLGRHLSLAQVADYLEDFDDSYVVYFFGVEGFHTRDSGMLFRSRDKIFVDVFPDGTMANTFVEARRKALGEAAVEAKRSRPNVLFLVPTTRGTDFLRIRENCPNGKKSQVVTTPNGVFSYLWYEVLDAQACVERVEQAGILKEAG